MASLPGETGAADAGAAMHDLLGGFSPGGSSPADDPLSAAGFATPAATPAGGSAAGPGPPVFDILGMEPGAAAPAPATAAAPPHANGDLIGDFGEPASHAAAAPEDIDEAFFGGGSAAADTATADAGLSDMDWLAKMGEAPAGPAAGGGAAKPPSSSAAPAAAAQPEEAGDAMLERVVAEAHAAVMMLPADRAQRLQGAIAEAEQYIEEQLVRLATLVPATA